MSYIGQREDEWEAGQKKRAKAAHKRSLSKCSICGTKIKGLKDHMREVHGCKGDGTPRPDQQVFLDRRTGEQT